MNQLSENILVRHNKVFGLLAVGQVAQDAERLLLHLRRVRAL